MKKTRAISIILLMVFFTLLLTSCGNQSIVGKWYSGDTTLEFTEDGNFICKRPSTTTEGHFIYKIEDNTIYYKDTYEGAEYEELAEIVKLSGSKLELIWLARSSFPSSYERLK